MARYILSPLLDLHGADFESLVGEADDSIMETALDLLLLPGDAAHNSFTNRI
jgi:hypothetical protein